MNKKLQNLIITYFLLLINSSSLSAQRFLSPTFSNFSIEGTKSGFSFMGTLGETFTGVKNANGYIIIEGIFSDFDFTSEVIVPQINNYKIFPNPSHGKVTLFNESTNSTVKFEIYNISGILLKSMLLSSVSSVNLTDLKSGTYIVHVMDENGIYSASNCNKLIIIK